MSAVNFSTEQVGPSSAVELAGRDREEPKVSLREIRRSLDYDSDTGVFTWKSINKHRSEKLGREAGVCSEGYIVIQIKGVKFRAHRLAWLMTFGYMPILIDHINGITNDNRIANLRDTTSLVNSQNHSKTKRKYSDKKSGLPVGVKLLASGNYQARATASGKCYALGSYKTVEEAHDRYKQFTSKHHDNPEVS